ncbi:MAG: hypothetical protein H6Q43_1355 [Deltaproteobacteria bacterium]|nr:hypothetical protein [Deltaproteobacteria bacterium]
MLLRPTLSRGEGVKKLKYSPSPFLLPQGGEGKYMEIQKEFPSPLTGEGQGGGGKWIFSHLRGERGNIWKYKYKFPPP